MDRKNDLDDMRVTSLREEIAAFLRFKIVESPVPFTTHEVVEEADYVAQHYDEMCYRLLRGDTLMRKVLDDSARAISLLQTHPQIDPGRTGILGHSYGGNTVLFHAALDERIRFACASGAACSYR